jgi:cytochrome c-type biogenesis protein
MDTLVDMNFGAALLAGLISFLSPCVLPLIPSYVGFITGMSLQQLTAGDDRRMVLKTTALNSLMFILGFSLVFILLGATATVLGSSLNRYQNVLRWVGGSLVIVLGAHFSGLINIRFLQIEKRLHLRQRPLGVLGAVLIGMAFAAGWTPCIGPILGSILIVAATESSIWRGMALLAVYSVGFGVPFFIAAMALNRFLITYKKFSRHIPKIIVISGVLLMLVGILIITNNLSWLGLVLTDWLG